ncbi:hypothetical protein EGW08_015492 [Elysia chlorotica]|uniref:BHLH domain-containing protein n=1 Tax=Elysia chlorotica TaxID=188477 RepID=A0A433T5E2_ELYCH|nr:hypothetical protein EGW08_015492 [Elysia chlorotica]
MTNYEGSPSVQFDSIFHHNFAGFLDAKTRSYNNYNAYSHQERSRSCPGYGEGQDAMSPCLYPPPPRNSPMYRPSCMLTPLSPYPASSPGSTVSQGNENYPGAMREMVMASPPCRRRLDFNEGTSVLELSLEAPVAVAKRNERERNRVKLINMTFQKLRQHLPLMGVGSKGKSRKLSKVQTLRSAIDYIRELQQQVHKNQQQQERPQHQQGALSKLHDEFLQMKYCSSYCNSSEEDTLAEDEDFFDENKSEYERYSPAQSVDDACSNSNNYNINSANIGSTMISHNDNNNNISRSANVGGGCALSEAYPSIISFGDEIKFIAEDHHLTSGNIPE